MMLILSQTLSRMCCGECIWGWCWRPALKLLCSLCHLILLLDGLYLHFVSRRRRKMYCGHAHLCVCLSVCLSAAVRPHYCTDPDVSWGRGRGCPLVVHYWADLQSGHGLRCYGNITRTLVTSLHPSAIWRHSVNGRLGWVCARCWPLTGGWGGGILNITAAVWTVGFHWWHSGNKKRTQNVSEYMLVLALCLVITARRLSAVNVLRPKWTIIVCDIQH